ncbi:MAG: tetratricopeptide repeat protein, partial [Candidatus Binatia bacterium]
RQALLTNKPEEALNYFQQAVQTDPDYVARYGGLQEGVWTYVGRTQYNLGRLSEARESLEKAVSLYPDDPMARLYLGLTLVRSGDRTRGLKAIESGLKGLYDRLEHVTYRTIYGYFWDPTRRIRSEIEKTLAMIAGRDIDRQELIASAEWVGRKMEEEIDRARQDKRQYRRERRRPMGTGVFMDLDF